jgi:hypothetical protein
MQNLTFSQCFKGAWQDTAQIFVKMPALTLALFLLCLWGFYDADLRMVAAQRQAAGDAAQNDPFGVLFTALWLVAILVAKARVIRFCMRDDAQRPFLAGVANLIKLNLIFGVCAIVVAGGAVLAYVALSGVKAGLPPDTRRVATLLAVLGVVALLAWFISIRLILMTTHVIMGGHFEWKKAWADTRRRFWSTLFTFYGIVLPNLAAFMALVVVRQYLSIATDTNALGYDIALFLSALCGLLYLISSATAYAWLYKRYAYSLVHEPLQFN